MAGTLRPVEAQTRTATRTGRTLALACVLALLACGLAACELLPVSPEPTLPTDEPPATLAPEPTTTLPPGVTRLVFWQPYALDRAQGLLLGEMVREFEAENPDILVEIVPKSGYVGLHGAMLAQLEIEPSADAGHDLPDLAVAFPSMIAEYARLGVVAPLDAYLLDPEWGLTTEDLAAIPAGYLDAGRLPGFGRQLMAFPFAQNVVGMWVNDSLLKQAGWDHVPATWAEFEQACYDVVIQTGVGCYPYIESVSTFDAWLYSRGGRQLDDAGRQALFNGPAGAESLALLRRLIDAGLAWRPAETFGDYVAFTNGQAAFTFSSSGSSRLYAEAYQVAVQNGMPPFRWHQALIPQSDPDNPATALYGASFFIVQGGTAGQQQAGWRLIRWFTDQPQTARWAAELEALPVRLTALEVMTDTLAAYPFVKAQVEQILPYARPEPALPAEYDVRDVLYTAILSVTNGYADPQTALDQAARDVNAILSREP